MAIRVDDTPEFLFGKYYREYFEGVKAKQGSKNPYSERNMPGKMCSWRAGHDESPEHKKHIIWRYQLKGSA